MAFNKTLLLFFITGLPCFVFPQNNEYYFRFLESNRNKVNTIITQTVSIDNIKGDTIYAYANQQEYDAFLKLGYKVEVLPHPSNLSAKAVVMATTIEEMAGWDRYPTYEVYRAMMKKFETVYPTLCKLDSIGTTVQGRKLYILKISDNVESNEPEPEVFYTSTMHGDETTGYILLLRLIDYLLSNYNALPQVKELVDNLQIYINPNANPDGTYYGGNSTVVNARRSNANGIDINRNFPDPRAGQHPDNNQWQPETQAMMNFATQHQLVLSANFHGGAEVVNYPWDTWTSTQEKHPDNDWFVTLSRAYVDTVHKYSPSTYMDGFENGITNGGDWYVVTGGRQDYMNYYRRCREITIELSNTKLLGSELLPTLWNYNSASLINYLKSALYGFGGTVKNTSNEPIDAEVIILNRDRLNSSVKTNPSNGQYFRLLEPGTYQIVAIANGYKPSLIEQLTVSANEYHTVNFTLEPDNEVQATESFEQGVPERLTFTNGTWIASNTAANTGAYSLKSPSTGNSQSTECILNIDVRKPGLVNFYHKVSSETGYDFFKFYIDGKLQGIWSGISNWERFTTALDVGAHLLKWVYIKDGDGTAGSDCVFIDDLSLPKCNGQINLTTTINSNAYENLKIVLGDSIRTTNTSGMVAFLNYPLDTTVNLEAYSESNLLGSNQVELSWQRVNYWANLSSHFQVTFEVSSKGSPLQNAIINFNGEQKQTDLNGRALFSNVPFGLQHPYSAIKDGYNPASGTVRVASDTLYSISTYPTNVDTKPFEECFSVYPNPIEGNFWVDIALTERTFIQVKLTDLTGKTIAYIHTGNANPGVTRFFGDSKAMNIQPGIYIFAVDCKKFSLRKKVVFIN